MTQSNLNQAGLLEGAKALCKSQGGAWEYLRFDVDAKAWHTKNAQAAISAYLECVGEPKAVSVSDIQDIIADVFLESEQQIATKLHELFRQNSIVELSRKAEQLENIKSKEI